MSNRFWRAMATRDAVRRQRTLKAEVIEDDDQSEPTAESAGIESGVPEIVEGGRQGPERLPDRHAETG